VLARQRQAAILRRVREQGGVRVSDLVDMLTVSDMTVRRDLEVLAEQGLLEKVHGGATSLARPSTDEPGFAEKSSRQQAEKRGIAMLAARLVRPGTAVGITAGTTTWALARELLEVPGLSVVTNSVPVADVMHQADGSARTVVLTGGVRTPSDALVGPVAVQTIRSLHLDLLFMGVHGMDEGAGFTTPNLMEAETNRAFLAATRCLVVLADSSKWGVIGLAGIAALADAAILVTDARLPRSAQDIVTGAGTDLRIAAPAARRAGVG